MWRAASAPTFASFISSEDLYNRTVSLEFYLPRSVETRKCRVPLPCRIDKTNSRNEHTHTYTNTWIYIRETVQSFSRKCTLVRSACNEFERPQKARSEFEMYFSFDLFLSLSFSPAGYPVRRFCMRNTASRDRARLADIGR